MFPRVFHKDKDADVLKTIETMIDNDVSTSLPLADQYFVYVQTEWLDKISCRFQLD